MAAVEPGGTAEDLSGMGMFAQELRAQRAKCGWTQVQLGAKIGYSDSYISDVERGDRLPSAGFATKCDEAFELPGTFARWQEVAKRTIYPSWFAPVIPYEQRASRINGWELGSLPGLLQTEDYARALIRVAKHSAPDDAVERLVIARIERQDIFTGDNPPRVWYVVDESSLRRVIGSTEIMVAQIDRLIAVAAIPGNAIQVLTYAGGRGIGTAGPITIYEFRDSQSMIGYAECYRGGRLIEDQAEVSEIMTDLNLIRMSALSPVESIELMRQIRS